MFKHLVIGIAQMLLSIVIPTLTRELVGLAESVIEKIGVGPEVIEDRELRKAALEQLEREAKERGLRFTLNSLEEALSLAIDKLED